MVDFEQGIGHQHGPYLVGEATLSGHRAPGAQEALAAAYAAKQRPLCLCSPSRPEMYIAKVAGTFVVKRMPESGVGHAVSCGSYCPPAHLSGLGQVLGQAIDEQPDQDRTALRLDFSLSKGGRAPSEPGEGTESDTVATDGSKLSLRAVLHYLWDEAGFTTWSPGMAGKRHWGVVSWYLRGAAGGKFVKGAPLVERLYIPPPWSKEKATQVKLARIAAWAPYKAGSGTRTQLMLLVGEVKAFGEARFGKKLTLKHMPDAPVLVNDDLDRKLRTRFASLLETWEADEDLHLVLAGTIQISASGFALLQEATLMLTDPNWLPFDTAYEQILLETAISGRRRFTRSLRYNLPQDTPVAAIVLTDTPDPTGCYLLEGPAEKAVIDELTAETDTTSWTWVTTEPLPDLPPQGAPRHHEQGPHAPAAEPAPTSAEPVAQLDLVDQEPPTDLDDEVPPESVLRSS